MEAFERRTFSGAVFVEVVLGVIILTLTFLVAYDIVQYFRAKQILNTTACMASRSIVVADKWHGNVTKNVMKAVAGMGLVSAGQNGNQNMLNVCISSGDNNNDCTFGANLCRGDCPQKWDEIAPYHSITFFYALPEYLVGLHGYLGELKTFYDNLGKLPERFLNNVVNYAQKEVLEILEDLLEPFIKIKEAIDDFINTIKQDLEILKQKFEKLWNDAKNQLSEVISRFTEIKASAENTINEIEDAMDDLNYYTTSLADYYNKITNIINSLPNDIPPDVRNSLNNITNQFNSEIQNYYNDAKNQVVNKLKSSMQNVVNSALYGKAILDGFINSAKAIYENISDTLQSIKSSDVETLKQIGEKLTKTVTSFSDTVTYFVKGAVYFGGLTKEDILNSIPPEIKNFSSSQLVEGIKQVIKELGISFDFQFPQITVGQLIEGVLNEIQPKSIEDTFNEIYNSLSQVTDVVRNTVNDIAPGGRFEKAKDKILDDLGKAIAATQSVKKLTELKGYIIGGIETAEEGLNDLINRTEGTLEGIFKVVDEAKELIPIAKESYEIIRQDVVDVIGQLKIMAEHIKDKANALIAILNACDDNTCPDITGVKVICCGLNLARKKIENLPGELQQRIKNIINNSIAEFVNILNPPKIFIKYYCVINNGGEFSSVNFNTDGVKCANGTKLNGDGVVGVYSIVGFDDYKGFLTPILKMFKANNPACGNKCSDDEEPPLMSASCLWPTYGEALKIY